MPRVGQKGTETEGSLVARGMQWMSPTGKIHTLYHWRYNMRTALYTIGLVALVVLALVGTSCKSDSSNPYSSPTSPSPPTPTNVPANTVLMSGMAFNPATITVSVGTTVTWKNDDGYAHTATSNTGVWDSGNIAGGASASYKFTSAGTYPYQCTYHAAMGMKGTVIVQ
jgi:plastocyanin